MVASRRVAIGCEAGLLAGAVVAGLFFVQDLVRLAPLRTPNALAGDFFGPGGQPMDMTLVTQVTTYVGFVFSVIGYTLLHFLAFACVGVLGAILLRCDCWKNSLVQSGLFGLVTLTAVFYGSRLVAGSPILIDSPGLAGVLGANLIAGLVIGGVLRWSAIVEEQEAAAAL